MYFVWDRIIQIEYFFHVFLRSLVLILPVPRIRGVYRGSIFFLSTDSTYSRVPGDQGGIFFGGRLTYKLVYLILNKIECNKFVCNEFILLFLQIDIIQSE